MRIVLTGGGSGGHVIPNIALIEQLKDKCELFYIGSSGIEQRLIEKFKFVKFYCYNPPKFKREFALSNLALPFKFVKAMRQVKKILQEIKPDKVFSKGGYVGLPVVLMANKLKIRCIGHESDSSVGLAHKLALNKYSTFFTAYNIKLPKRKCNVIKSGAIIRQSIYLGERLSGIMETGFNGQRPILLVLGGSLGANSLNKKIIECSDVLTRSYDCFVICGKGKNNYINQPHIRFVEYCDNIAEVYKCARIAITRGGASALAELACLGIPFISVPLIKASRREQEANTDYFVKAGCGFRLNEENINPISLESYLTRIEKNYSVLRSASKRICFDSTVEIAEYLLK
ncbi:MAG: UDP-N-acetylglucosamine--N-acetylmuramyl-(pentapeptide) pyrophosphoryl-undecaprenol N-acetylglucosamine transferase [Clostridia bacterium]